MAKKKYTEMLTWFNLKSILLFDVSVFPRFSFINIVTTILGKMHKLHDTENVTSELPGERITMAVSRAYSS